MVQNIVEYLREEVVSGLFSRLSSFNGVWPIWKPAIQANIGNINAVNVINLGNHLSSIFRTTSNGRTQSSVSGGGTSWEALVCWYLNLCLIETRTVVIKHRNDLIPSPIREAITVKYGTFPSNTESDLIAITFPDKPNYSMDKLTIKVRDNNGQVVPSTTGRRGKFNYLEIINALMEQDFNEIEIGIIQCKTNWNDNAQIPMLWDMVYSSTGFIGQRITVGSSVYSIRNIKKFSYSFVTVPTSSNNGAAINSNSTCVKRVENLSGGNYWGMPTIPSVALSIKDIFGRNFASATTVGIRTTLNGALPKLSSTYSYFDI